MRLGFLRLGKDGNKDITKKPVAILKLFEGWFTRKNKKDQVWLAVGTMPAAFKAKPDVAAAEPEPEEPEEEEPPKPMVRLRGKQPLERPDEGFDRYLESLLKWLRTKENRMATAAEVMRHLRRIPGFAAYARQHPFANRAANIVMNFSDVLELVSGGSFRNPKIRAKVK